MNANTLTIKLTDEQQKQIKNATGRNVSELIIDLDSTGSLSEKELSHVAGGAVGIHFKY